MQKNVAAIFGIFILASILVIPAFAQSSAPTTPGTSNDVSTKQAIPSSPTDDQGVKLGKFPLIQLTPRGEVETDLTWDPSVILTGEKVTFIFQFYDPSTSLTKPLTSYHFVILQNGNEIFSTDGTTQEGGDYKYFVFNQPGPIQIKFEKIGGNVYSTEYSTIVYSNPSGIKSSVQVNQPPANLAFNQWDAFALIGLPIAGIAAVVVYAKWGSKFRKKRTQSGKMAI